MQTFRDRVAIDFAEGLADVRMIRVAKMNALDNDMFEALCEALDYLENLSGLRAVALSGEGRAFCAGIDQQTLQESFANGGRRQGVLADLIARTHGPCNAPQYAALGWRFLPVPVIVALHGVAFGGGLQLALGGDVRFAAPDAQLSIMEIRWGLVPDMGGMLLAPPLIRDDVLRDLIFTGRIVNGAEAQTIGLVTHVNDDPRAAALDMARRIASLSPSAVRAGKKMLNAAVAKDAEKVLLAESLAQTDLFDGAHHKEAVKAQLERRSANFEDL